MLIQINEGVLFKETWNNNSSIKFLSPSNKETEVLISLIKETSEASSILCFSPIGKDKFSSILIQKKNNDTLKLDSKDYNYSGIIIKEISIEGISFFKIQIDQTDITSVSKLIIENIIRNYQTNQP